MKSRLERGAVAGQLTYCLDCEAAPPGSGFQKGKAAGAADGDSDYSVGSLVADGTAEALLHIERLPLEARVVADDRLHRGIVGEELGRDVPGAVEPLEELQLVRREREHRGHELAGLPNQGLGP